MPSRLARAAVSMSLVLAWVTPISAQPVGTAFTYQGRLNDGATPADAAYDLRFALFDAAIAGSQIGAIVTKDDVAVASGLFSVSLDFGSAAFTGSKRWLEIAVRPGASSGAYTTLSPRQELTPSPNALFSQVAPWAGLSGVPAGFADNTDNDALGALSCANDEIAKRSSGVWGCAADADSGGTITGITAGAGLTGGGRRHLQRQRVGKHQRHCGSSRRWERDLHALGHDRPVGHG